MKLQLLSDLHLETEAFDPQPLAGADLLVLAGDIDTTWDGYRRFAGWPVPVYAVAGNHEFERHDLVRSVAALRDWLASHGITLLHRQCTDWTAPDGTCVRLIGTPRWSDYAVFGGRDAGRARRAGAYFLRAMQARRDGLPLDVDAMTAEGLACRAWLERELVRPLPPRAHRIVATHFAPSLRSLDPRYGRQPGTASFCNADDDLVDALGPGDLWIHGHVHCRHDWRGRGGARVICQARGFERRGETLGYDADRIVPVETAPSREPQRAPPGASEPR